MGSKYLFLVVILTAVLCFSCKTDPNKTENGAPVEIPASNDNKTEVVGFDPTRVSQAQYASTRDEVRSFIENLNQIIRSRNYEAWKASLSPEYFAEISSQKNLHELSSLPAMKSRRIVLRVPEDYFQYVVVPSRADLRVDDIEFIGSNRVKAFTLTTNKAGEEVRLRLYDLEKIGNSWTIIN